LLVDRAREPTDADGTDPPVVLEDGDSARKKVKNASAILRARTTRPASGRW